MYHSLYLRDLTVPPVYIETYRGMRRRVRMGMHLDRGPSVLHDCFPDVNRQPHRRDRADNTPSS